MDFSWSDEQLQFKQRVVEFAQSNLNDDVIKRDREAEFSRALWQKCADFGIQGWLIPEEFGGSDLDLMTVTLGIEALGYGCHDNGLTLAINAHLWAFELALVRFGTDEQHRKYLPGLCDGSAIGAHALAEPEAGSDAFSLTTTAKRVDGGYILNGTKSMVTLGPVADLFLVLATEKPGTGMWGVVTFIVEKGTNGLMIGDKIEKMGVRSVPLGAVELTDCFVPDANRLGAEGAGGVIMHQVLEWDHCFVMLNQIGAMERLLETTIAFAQNREQFGKPIGKFQAVSHRIVDMKLRLEASRLLAYRAVWLMSSGGPAALESSLAKLMLSESFLQSAIDSMRTHGGKGFFTETEIERQLRDAIGGITYSGTSDIHKNIIARRLGL